MKTQFFARFILVQNEIKDKQANKPNAFWYTLKDITWFERLARSITEWMCVEYKVKKCLWYWFVRALYWSSSSYYTLAFGIDHTVHENPMNKCIELMTDLIGERMVKWNYRLCYKKIATTTAVSFIYVVLPSALIACCVLFSFCFF